MPFLSCNVKSILNILYVINANIYHFLNDSTQYYLYIDKTEPVLTNTFTNVQILVTIALLKSNTTSATINFS